MREKRVKQPECAQAHLLVDRVELLVLRGDLVAHVDGHVAQVAHHLAHLADVRVHLVLARVVRYSRHVAACECTSTQSSTSRRVIGIQYEHIHIDILRRLERI